MYMHTRIYDVTKGDVDSLFINYIPHLFTQESLSHIENDSVRNF